MRFSCPEKKKHPGGWQQKFLLFPRRIEGQCVWLEWVDYRHVIIDWGNWAGGGHGRNEYKTRDGLKSSEAVQY